MSRHRDQARFCCSTSCVAAPALAAALLFGAGAARAQLPDLIIHDAGIDPVISFEEFPDSDCVVVEGCASPGLRKLLRFTTESRNIGEADLVLGSPTENPLFHLSECHGHYHFEEFADYRLLDGNGEVARGHKAGFCLMDSYRFDRHARKKAKYDCENQGIQAGWADVYGSALDCQWVDITDVSPGSYVLEIEVNPAQILTESDYSNNVTAVEVVIPEIVPPANDDCIDAMPVTDGATSFSTFLATTDGPDEPYRCTFFQDAQITSDIWFLYEASCDGDVTVSLCGSTYDTELAVYAATGCPSEPGSVLACNDDSCGLQSEVVLPAVSGELFLIRVGGFQGAQGDGTLDISCRARKGKGGGGGNGNGNGRGNN